LPDLRCVNAALTPWDEIHAVAEMPAERRPVVTLPPSFLARPRTP
jgi:hypothetical protein